MLVIVDADALIVLSYFKHEKHKRGKMIFDHLIKNQVHCIYPITALCEAVTVLQKPLQQTKSAQFLIERFKEGVLPTQEINEEILSEALAIYSKFDIKNRPGDTLFDAIIAAIAIRRKANAIFSFDTVYQRIGMGLRLAEEFF